MIVIFGELYSSKNSKQIYRVRRGRNQGRPFIAKSDVAQRYDKDTKPLVDAMKHIWRRMIEDKPFPLRVQFKIYRRTHGAFDYVNIIQGLLDLMVARELLPDDTADTLIPVFEPYEVDPQNPRVEIEVL